MHKLLFALLGIAVAVATGSAHAADPQPCQRLNGALSEAQRGKAVAWLHREFPGTDFSFDYTCKADAKRIVVSVADFGGLQNAVYVLDVSGDQAQARKLLEGGVETPVVVARPGGGLDLFFVQQQPDKGLLLRAYRTVSLEGGEIATLFAAHFDNRARGCAGATGVPRVLVAAAVRFSDVNKDGTPDIVLDREIEDCGTRQSQRAEEVFLATPQGWRKRP